MYIKIGLTLAAIAILLGSIKTSLERYKNPLHFGGGAVVLNNPKTPSFLGTINIAGQIVTPAQTATLITALENQLDTNPNALTIQQALQLPELINLQCPSGFSVGEIRNGITINQIKTLLNGNCIV